MQVADKKFCYIASTLILIIRSLLYEKNMEAKRNHMLEFVICSYSINTIQNLEFLFNCNMKIILNPLMPNRYNCTYFLFVFFKVQLL